MNLRGFTAILSVLFFSASAGFAQSKNDPNRELPVVKSGEMPLYPALARVARIQGEIHLKVVTDGSKVSSVTVESGQPMLAKAAQENIETWTFLEHKPTTFSTIFLYHLRDETTCKSSDSDNGQILLELPIRVEITSRILFRSQCDPNWGLDLTEPLRVFLTKCEIDNSSVACDDFKVSLQSGSLVVLPERFHDSDHRQGFVVPKQLRTMKAFDIVFETKGGNYSLANLDIAWLKGNWSVGIAHAPFDEDSVLYGLRKDTKCAGFAVFEWGEPETVVSSPCN